MGITYLPVTITNPTDIKRSAKLDFMIDSGVVYSVVPSQVLSKLGIRSDEERDFMLANGKKMTRKVGIARFVYNGHKGGAPVVFGEKHDNILLGATTLEAMGFVLNPFQRELLKLPMVLG